MSTLATALSAIVILLVGGAIGFYLARVGQSATEARCDEIQQDYDAYRAEVAEHFGKTADQFHAIGLQYRELYEHLAAGSAKLCELEPPGDGVPFPPAIEAQEADAALAEAQDPEQEAEPVVDEAEALTDSEERAADVEVADADQPPADFVAGADGEVVAEEDEPKPDNVVELVPRADDEGDAGKQTYS